MDPMEDPDDILRANRSREKTYMFDVAFDFSASQVCQELKKKTKKINLSKSCTVFILMCSCLCMA